MNRSNTALLIALMLHIILLLLALLLERTIPEVKPVEKKEEKRIKVSLKDQPKTTKQAPMNNKKPKEKIAPPMPKGEQLKKIIKKPMIQPTEKELTKKAPENKTVKKPSKPKEIKKTKPKSEPIPSKKPNIYIPKETNTTIVKKEKPKEHSKLYDMLSKKQPDQQEESAQKSTRRHSQITTDVKKLYGEKFGELSEGEQKYILDNQEVMRRITQQVLNRVGPVNIPRDLRVNKENIVEFYLLPNGDITEIKFLDRSGFYLLDDTTKETIEYAYSRYPRPEQKTLIRYKVGYYLRGY